jgi:hypothetical protein
VVLGEFCNFPLSGVKLGHCVDGFRWFLGSFENFFLSVVDLGHCVDSFRWFLGSYAISLCRGLICGFLWMVFGGSWEVMQFPFVAG